MYSIAIQFGNSIRFSCLIELKTKRIQRETNKYTHTELSLSLPHFHTLYVWHILSHVGGVTRPRVRVIFSNFSTFAAIVVVYILRTPLPPTVSLLLLLLLRRTYF